MFDESKHPRDKIGRFTTSDGMGGTHEATPAENERLKELGIHQSGAISGAQSGAIDEEKEFGRAQKHAEIMYETFRNTDSDIKKIAQITGHGEEEIKRVKNHLFFNEYDFDDGHHRFDPDFQQAQSWDRLRKGEALEHDLVMIEHELVEEKFMREDRLSYDEAHEKANKVANYQKAIEEYKNASIKKKRD